MLQLPEQRAFDLVDGLTSQGVFVDGLVASVEFGYGDGDEDDEDDIDVDVRPSSVFVVRGFSRLSPTRGRGMDELGFFPYTLAETEDRIALIDNALEAGHPIPERMNRVLRSARSKLCDWRLILGR